MAMDNFDDARQRAIEALRDALAVSRADQIQSAAFAEVFVDQLLRAVRLAPTEHAQAVERLRAGKSDYVDTAALKANAAPPPDPRD
jgi:hypothetical protein